jgi:hypothetical protein
LRGEVRPLPPAVIEATQATHALRAHGFQPPRGTPSPCRAPRNPSPVTLETIPPWVATPRQHSPRPQRAGRAPF